VPGGVFPDLVGHRVRPVAEPSDGLGERQRGAFGLGEPGRIPPGRHREETLVRFAFLLALQPLIWLARSSTRSSVRAGTPPFSADAFRAIRRGLNYAASALQRPFWTRTCNRWAAGSVRAMSFRSPSE